MAKQRRALQMASTGGGLTERHLSKHLGDITEALVLIHLGWEAPAYRFETRRQMEAWFRQQEWTSVDDLDAWYGIILEGGQDERVIGWLAAWKAVGAARVHGLLSSLDRIVANRMVPLASSQ